MSTCVSPDSLTLLSLPDECHVHILTYLRAFEISATQRTCRFYNNPDRIHEVVLFFMDHVYGPEFTKGLVVTTPTGVPNSNHNTRSSNNNSRHSNKGKHGHNNKKKSQSSISNIATSYETFEDENRNPPEPKYTLENLRYIELKLVAKVLSLPEPVNGFYVSKSWIKKTLLWLEKVDELSTVSTSSSSANNSKKLSKKQQRQRNRRLSDVSPPWPNANSDILCEHHNLQRCSQKAARSRRKLMDKQAWKVLRKLYPDSTQLESVSGECLQCLMETETARKNEQDRLEQEKLERKKPLANPHVRRFYTRTKGVPTECLVDTTTSTSTTDGVASTTCTNHQYHRVRCPLISGTYIIIPRAWCHQWRRYMKSGEGSMPLPPESSALLCDAHKLALLPPHLEAFLSGETPQLLASVKQDILVPHIPDNAPSIPPVGMQPTLDLNMINALMAAGISQAELASQRLAMLQLQEQQQAAAVPVAARRDSFCNNELLDRENHVVVELVSHEEWLALQETGCWPKQFSHYSVSVNVDRNGAFGFSTLPCRDCDATGLRFTSCASIKNKFRSKRWEPKSVEQKRIPNMEY